VRPDEGNPYIDDLRSLVLKAYGPTFVIGDAVAAVAGVEAVYIFGSWAARLGGEPGPPPEDVDVLVVGEPDAAVVDAALQEAEARLGREVHATLVSPAEWRAGTSRLLRTIMRRPLVQIMPVDAA
jgi:predicted nucleotidyltransferase